MVGWIGLGHRPYVQLEHRWAALIIIRNNNNLIEKKCDPLVGGTFHQNHSDQPNISDWPETVTKSLIAEQIHQMATHAEEQEELIWCGRHNSDSRFGTQLFSITSVVLVHIVKLGLCLSRAVISLQANNYNSANRFLKANYFCSITASLLPAGGQKANISKARGRRI